MSKRTDYTATEWKAISSAPIMAGLLVIVSDLNGPIGFAKELFAVINGITDVAPGSTNELIRAIADDMKERSGKPDLPEISNDQASARITLIEGCKQAVLMVSQKSPLEADEYKRWLTSLAQKASGASKEGGFFGFGGTQVSDEEKAAINELNTAIGVSAQG